MPSSTDSPEFDTIYFDNGDYYEGYVINGIPHGKGTMFYADGTDRDGEWLSGMPITSTRIDTKIPGYSDNHYRNSVTIGYKTMFVGNGYYNEEISNFFGVSKFIRGIRIHRDIAVLFSLENSVYRDGFGWEKDSDGEYIFVYTGEGLEDDQVMNKGNFFVNNSHGGLYLFVRKKPNDYVFHGEVAVKRCETAVEPDRNGKQRKVFKFILRRV